MLMNADPSVWLFLKYYRLSLEARFGISVDFKSGFHIVTEDGDIAAHLNILIRRNAFAYFEASLQFPLPPKSFICSSGSEKFRRVVKDKRCIFCEARKILSGMVFSEMLDDLQGRIHGTLLHHLSNPFHVSFDPAAKTARIAGSSSADTHNINS
jgi:hypothetical protein